MEEPMETVENTLYGAGWDQPLPAIMYSDEEEHRKKQQEILEGMRVEGRERANTYIRRLKMAQDELDAELEYVRTQREKIAYLEDKVKRRHKRTEIIYHNVLKEWAYDELARAETKKRSVDCIEGTLAFRSATDELVYEINDVIEAAKRNGFPQVIVTKESVSDKELKKALSEGGDLPAKLIAREDHFNVKFADD